MNSLSKTYEMSDVGNYIIHCPEKDRIKSALVRDGNCAHEYLQFT